MLKYPAILHREEDGYWVEFPDLKGCVTEGDTTEELMDNAEEALTLYLEEYVGNEKKIPRPSQIKSENIVYVNVLPDVGIPLLIRLLREEQHLTQGDLAKKMGIKYQTYQQIENFKKFNATVKTLGKIARAFGKKLLIDFK